MPFISAKDFYADMPAPHLRELRKQWQRFAVTGSHPDPCCCAPAWNLSFLKIFNSQNRVYYHLDEDALVVFSEYKSLENGIYLAPLEDSWMFGTPMLGIFAPEAFSCALNQWRLEYGSRLPPILLSSMGEDDITSVKFFLRFRKHFNFYRTYSMIEGCASLRGGMEGWLSRRSANHRAKLKKAMKKAVARGITFERHHPICREEAAALYERMIKVEKRSWKGVERCGMAESPSREFYNELIGRQALDRAVLLIFARLDDKDIGFIYGACCGQFYRGQQFSYVNDMADLSIGNLMQFEKVKWLCELGLQRYDMGPITGPRMGYKNHWTEIQKESQVWVMRQL